MSRIAKNPISIPAGIEVNASGRTLTVKGPKGALERSLPDAVAVVRESDVINFEFGDGIAKALAGTTRALVNNMVLGVSKGFERKLELVGVGYRAQVQGKTLNLTLGYSHPVNFAVPGGITIETPSQTEIVVKGVDKQLVGQVAAEIRSFRPPEPYKGKGVRYANEVIVRKEAKKK
ncbi:MAG: 50S ribosomal protein L6 [Gammaproteobacteria bacterium]|nr:50S ribosomal protein L6 [Gammaproteobacteria bacterium]